MKLKQNNQTQNQNGKCPPILLVKQRMILKTQTMSTECFDGFATTLYSHKDVAKKVSDSIKNSGQKCELIHGDIVKQYFPGQNSWAIFDLFLRKSVV